jgi:hypothetical protein
MVNIVQHLLIVSHLYSQWRMNQYQQGAVAAAQMGQKWRIQEFCLLLHIR